VKQNVLLVGTMIVPATHPRTVRNNRPKQATVGRLAQQGYHVSSWTVSYMTLPGPSVPELS